MIKTAKQFLKKANRPLNGQWSIGLRAIFYISVLRKLDNNGQCIRYKYIHSSGLLKGLGNILLHIVETYLILGDD